jgi:DNA-binding MarR family transcriptional regulator
MSIEEGERAGADQRLGFLLARHGAVTDTRIRAALQATGLKPQHGVTLLNLAERGSVSQQSLIGLLGVDPSVVVTILNDLEGYGLVERRRAPADRRRHIVELTPKGASMLEGVERALSAVERELFADLSEEETAQLRALLSRVRTRDGDPPCSA